MDEANIEVVRGIGALRDYYDVPLQFGKVVRLTGLQPAETPQGFPVVGLLIEVANGLPVFAHMPYRSWQNATQTFNALFGINI